MNAVFMLLMHDFVYRSNLEENNGCDAGIDGWWQRVVVVVVGFEILISLSLWISIKWFVLNCEFCELNYEWTV